MARPLRIEFEGAIYHVCARGNDRRRVFLGDRNRAHFLDLLGRSRQRFKGAVIGFVLMENHFHLIVQTRESNLARWMHWLMVSYSVAFNRRHRRSGHLFQGRYKSFLVQEGEYLLALSRYLHLNPVRGMSLGKGTPLERRERLRRFEWSNYRGAAGLARPWPFVEENMVLEELGGPARKRRRRYRAFVEEGLVREIENPFEAVRWQVVLGEESFAQKLRDLMKERGEQRREITGLRQAKRRLEEREVLARVAKKYGLSVERLLRPQYGRAACNVAMWLLWENGARSLREIGELFGGLDYAAVGQRIRRLDPAQKRQAARLFRNHML